MSTVKCVCLMSAAGALATGGMSLYRGAKARKNIIASAQKVSDSNNGKIPTGGRTKDGKLWDGFTTVEAIKKDTKKGLAIGTAVNTLAGGITTGIISALTLLAKSHLK